MQIIGRTIRHIAVEDTVLRAQGYHRVSAGNCLIIYRIDDYCNMSRGDREEAAGDRHRHYLISTVTLKKL